MSLLYTDTDSFKLLTRNNNPDELKKHSLENYIDTYNFPIHTIPVEPGKNDLVV